MKVVDVENKILGRAATKIAELAREGEEIRVVNTEKAVISGDKEKIFQDYKQKYDRGRRDTGPYFPKRPDRIFKRTVKNMLPKSKQGQDQLANIKTYIGQPEEFNNVETLNTKEGKDLKNRNYVKLQEVSKFIGWNPAVEVEN